MTSYNFSLDARAANIRYLPTRDGPIEQGWSYIPDHGGARRTTFAGARAEIDWFGTAIEIQGAAEPSTYRIFLDEGEPQDGQPTSDGMLGTFTDLENKNHTLALEVVQGSAEVRFYQVKVTIQLGEAGYRDIFPIDGSQTVLILPVRSQKNETKVPVAIQDNGTNNYISHPFFQFDPPTVNWVLITDTHVGELKILVVCTL
jgi:hypothetical protein